MSALAWLAMYVVVAILTFGFMIWSDRRWYKRHPGANQCFALIDNILESEGR